MVLRPTTLPTWAQQDELNPEINNYNVIEPPTEKQLYGWAYKDFLVRNWLNWLGRWTYRNLAYLIQQEAKEVVTDGFGVGLFPTPPTATALCILYAVDVDVPTNYIFAIGSNNAGTLNFEKVAGVGLTIPANPIVGPNVPIGGAIAEANVIVCGQTKSQAVA